MFKIDCIMVPEIILRALISHSKWDNRVQIHPVPPDTLNYMFACRNTIEFNTSDRALMATYTEGM